MIIPAAVIVTFTVVLAVTPLPSVADAVITDSPIRSFTVTIQLPSSLSSIVAILKFDDFHLTVCDEFSGSFFTRSIILLSSFSGFTPIFLSVTGVLISSSR